MNNNTQLQELKASLTPEWAKEFAKCDSPIEELFFLGMCQTAKSFNEENDAKLESFVLQSQVVLEGVRSVADFVLLFRVESNATLFRMVVELDGHNFHERTKEQASRDRSRDRRFMKNMIPVVRFTGHEVWCDPPACALEAMTIGSQWAVLYHLAQVALQ